MYKQVWGYPWVSETVTEKRMDGWMEFVSQNSAVGVGVSNPRKQPQLAAHSIMSTIMIYAQCIDTRDKYYIALSRLTVVSGASQLLNCIRNQFPEALERRVRV